MIINQNHIILYEISKKNIKIILKQIIVNIFLNCNKIKIPK